MERKIEQRDRSKTEVKLEFLNLMKFDTTVLLIFCVYLSTCPLPTHSESQITKKNII